LKVQPFDVNIDGTIILKLVNLGNAVNDIVINSMYNDGDKGYLGGKTLEGGQDIPTLISNMLEKIIPSTR
jgi:hypothetical protein